MSIQNSGYGSKASDKMYHMVSSPCVYNPISGMKTLFINYFGRKYRVLQSRFEEKAWSSTWHSVNEIGIVIDDSLDISGLTRLERWSLGYILKYKEHWIRGDRWGPAKNPPMMKLVTFELSVRKKYSLKMKLSKSLYLSSKKPYIVCVEWLSV